MICLAADERQEERAISSENKPVVLLLATSEWVSTARLAMELAGMGCRVELVSSRSHPSLSTRAVAQAHRYDPLRPLRSLRAAIELSCATALIAVDEVMVGHLEELWCEARPGSALRTLIDRSTGGQRAMEAAASRMTLLRTATAAGVLVPPTLPVNAESDVKKAVLELALPMVLKSDASSGGRGVRVADNLSQAEAAWRALHQAPGLVRAVKRGLVGREWLHLRPWARGETRGVTAQKFLPGQERTAMAVCRDGEVLACVCLEVVETWKLRGPSSVVRVVADAVVESAVKSVAAALRVSGFCGFDFMTQPESDEPLLIEMNPRPTQLAHLSLGAGKDLVAAFVRALVGLDVQDREAATTLDVVALFPQELQRDAESDWLATAFHDVPWGEPALMRRAMKSMRPAKPMTKSKGSTKKATMELPPSITHDPRWHDPARVDLWVRDVAAEHEFAR